MSKIVVQILKAAVRLPALCSQDNLLVASSEKEQSARSRKWWPRWYPWVAHAVLFCLWLPLYLSLRPSTDRQCARQLSTPFRFNGSLTYPSIFRGSPSPELDAAWDRISTVRPIAITDDDLSRAGKPILPSLVKINNDGRYIAELEVVHQLHCLNMLREFTHPEKYSHGEEDPELYRNHIDHCIEMLRQQIMCTGDTGLVTFHWVEGHVSPWPDFNTWHQCRDYEKIMEWRDERVVHLPLEISEDIARLKEAP
ncbi:predicted protein [Postia placenta Mad-698-R]|uniref:Tat pathway signal sequence n=1 Tax=Postia placenta MAD-698-R-SB12 TaxID=670580 RepID=A0A1X6MYS0_9APHY|nr:hypothetical protein POSPLADRAFT_1046850 [Postia placenta MAD-698-R-SB12]EED83399.1 predicted protein [Postia placenta Mad-698-R]OSX61509.1 hypothetical protein POSPLADRAFT_1046850 [Postia placenta MAD-698-R-SB12]